MSMSKKLILIFLVLTGLVLSGCASIQKADPAKDKAAKQFSANPAVAQVYVYRNEALGAALSMPVTVDGKLAGTTGSKSYFKFDLAAGKHTLTSQGEGSKLDVDVEAGKIYFVWQEVKMGVMSGGSKLQLVDEKKGKAGVKECTLIESKL